MRIGVVGHVEWVQFLRVAHVPARGEILQASSGWEEAGGGGSVAAAEIARLAGASTLFTVLGDDDWGHRAKAELEGLDIRVEAVFRPEPQRRAVTFVDDGGERTISLVGDKLRPRFEEPLPWEELAAFDGIYFTAGNPEVLRAARRARVLVATARELPTLLAAPEVELDAVVSSANDPSEKYAGELPRTPRLVVRTDGASGGTCTSLARVGGRPRPCRERWSTPTERAIASRRVSRWAWLKAEKFPTLWPSGPSQRHGR